MPRYDIDWATLTVRLVLPKPKRARCAGEEERPIPYRHRARPVSARMVRAEVDGDAKASYLAKRTVIDWDTLEEKVEYYWTAPRREAPKNGALLTSTVAAKGILVDEVCPTCGGPTKGRHYPDIGQTIVAQCKRCQNGHK